METVNEFLRTLASKGVKLSAEAGQLNCYAPSGSFTNDDIRKGIARHKPEILALLEGRAEGPKAQAVRNVSPKPREFPLSAGQKGLYILQKINPGMTAYNLPLCVKISGDINVDLLAKAWSFVLEQYPILTARIVENDGTFYHHLDARCRTTVQEQAVAFTDEQNLTSFLRQRVKQPFDLDRGPLSRIELFTLSDRERILLVTIHHMIFDGVSAVVLLRSLLENCQALSEGRPVSVSPELRGYHDFVAWEEAMLTSAEGRSHADYWQRRLSGELPNIELFPDLPRLASPTFEGASLVKTLPADISRGLREFARKQSFLPSVVFLAAFKLLLSRYTSQEDIVVGMPVIVRPGQKFATEIGYFINMVPLRTQCRGELKLTEFLREVRKTMMDAIYHSSYPFELMLDKLRTVSATKNAVFQVNFAYQNFIGDDSFSSLPRQEGLDVENVAEIGPEGYSDLGLEIFEKAAVFSLHVRYNPDIYARSAIERFCQHYAVLLKSISDGGNLLVHEYSTVPEQEKRKLLVEFNDTDADYPKDKCVHDFFVENALLYPGRTAVSYAEQALSYQELHHKTSRLAVYLQWLGIKPESIVGLCLERSLEMMVGIMGTVQAGGAYLPLDPDYPDERLTPMLQDSNAAIVLTQEKFRVRINSMVPAGASVICLDAEWPEISRRADALEAEGVELRREVTSRNACYVIYTSGSTGKPKGALVEHQALVNRLHWMQKRYRIDGSDVVLQKTPYSFDVSVWEFFWPMMTGASVVFATPDGHKDVHYLERLIDMARVTTMHFVPSMLRSFLDNANTGCGSVRQIFASGEVLDRQSVDRYKTKFPNAALHNLYGPTEAAIDVTSFDCSHLTHAFVPIGAPIDNIQLYILDPHNHPQPIGVAGELHIAGDGLARGYLNRPELTQEKFVPNPFRPGARMYRTGDLACWMDDGNIQYLGRIDTQVKIRGFRVEIGEIEARLNQYAQIQDSAVIVRGQNSDKQLIGFYRANETTADHLVQLPNEELRAHLLRTLPEYMVPAAFVTVVAIPVSSNGKVDRRALARMDVSIASGQAWVAPRNDTEKQLVEIWGQVLNMAPATIGTHDNFFELGGHSLRAAQLIAKIRRQMDVDVPLKAFFEGGTVAQLARFVGRAGKSEIPAIRPVDRARFEQLPLSFAQERLWFINQLEPDSTGYNLPGAVTISGELDIDQLEQAFNLVIARHENLRSLFPSEGGRARQQILDRVDFKLERVDLSHYTDSSVRSTAAAQRCRANTATPFDLANGPLLRGTVIRLAEHEHILMLNMHHIISDGWSIGVLINELRVIMDAFREGRQPLLAPLPIQYVDYSVWQRKWLQEGGVLQQQLGYWKEKLAGIPESLELATDYPRPNAQSFAGATHAFALDAQLTEQLKHLAKQQGGTLYMALLSAFNVLLLRYTGQNDLCVGSPIANRQYGETEGLIGMFVNTLALRTQIEGDDTFAGLLSKVKATCLEAYENQDAPFEKVVDVLHVQRNMAISPIFQVMLILQNVDMGTPDQRIQPYLLDSSISKFDLTFEFTETAEGLTGSIEYSTALYKAETIARMVGHFISLCKASTASPVAKIQDLEYLGEAETQRLVVDFNATEAEYPKEKCIHDFFAEQVLLNASKTAVAFGEETLTYQELYDRSYDLALYLQSEGVGPDSIVGLCLDRSLEMMVGIMGTVLAGGAYLPLDPDYPDERLTYMLLNGHAPVVLTQEKWAERVSALASGEAKVVALDTQWSEVLKPRSAELRREVAPHNLCYVIYTSGSTGKPKGVLNEHGALVNRLHWMQKSYPLSQNDVVLQKTPYSFDVSVWEFFWPMMTGASIAFAAPGGHKDVGYLEDLINEAKVTTLHYVPSMLYTFLENARDVCGSVRQVFCSGEALDKKAVDRYKTRFPNAIMHNLYGPTEAAIDVTSFDCATLTYPFVPIGTPIDNIQIYILDQQNHPQPIGVPGELHIAGDGLARGYLNRPELTQEKFVANAFKSGARMYKTGDMARWLDDGNIQYLSRIDTQVKIRGFRIELGEIEARLNQHTGIQDSAVVARGEGVDKHLVAFYRAKETTADEIVHLPSEELRAHLLQTLPDYMVPSALVSLAAIPLNPNGKADRGALTRMDVTMASDRAYVASRTETERQLVAIWAEVLKVVPAKIGINDNFFELGGHSLLATQLISKIRSELAVDLPLKALFERSNVAQLAELIAATERSDTPAIRPIDRTQFDRLPLSFAQERLWFINQLEPDSPGYNVPGAIVINGELDVDALERAFNRIIARHESLRTVFPSEEGHPQQRILDGIDFRLQRIDLSGDDKDARGAHAKRICQSDATTLFDLANGPLLRGTVIRLDEQEHILMLNMHHIISDGWSAGVLINELRMILDAFREGRQPQLAPLPIQYVDYSVWQRQWLEEGGVLEQQLAYWRDKLAGVPENLDLATDFPRPSVQTYAGATHTFVLDRQLTRELKRLAEQQGGTLYMVLLSAFNVLLHRYTGQNDLCVGSPIANRQHGETEGLIGMFVNTLALRTQIEGDDTFADLLSKVKATCLEAYENQDAPFEKVVDVLHLQRNMAISPVFQVMLILQNVDMGTPDPSIQLYPLDSGIAKVDLTVEFTETSDGLAGSIRYRTALYTQRTIARIAEHFIALGRAIIATPTAQTGDLDYIGDAEKRQLLVQFNDNNLADRLPDKCLHELFVEQAARDGNRTAVVCGDARLTYQQLYEKSRDLALYLQSEGVKPEDLVGLCTDRSLDMVVGLLGILQAGGAYVPLDPDYPDERLAYMVRDSHTSFVLTQARLRGKLSTLIPADTRLVALDWQWPEIADHAADLKAKKVLLQKQVTPHHLAYVIYTSGSTGMPKGVMVEHGHIVSYVTAIQKKLQISEGSSFALVSTFAADLGNTILFPSLLGGGTLHVLSGDATTDAGCYASYCGNNRIDCMKITASHLQALVAERVDPFLIPTRTLVLGGEVLSRGVVDWIRRIHPDCRIYNHYGPTECSVGVLCGEVGTEVQALLHAVPLGSPLSGMRIYVLDGRGQPVPIGIAGELYIGGAQVARGYLNQPALTAELFLPDRFNPGEGTRIYKTGDVARWLADGTVEYLGRNDFQVKIRGFRVELGEIEAQLLKHSGVKEAIVIAREDEPGEKRLVAYLTTVEALGVAELRSHMLASVPQYMVPAAFVELDAIPLTPNGKVDRRALPRPEAQAYASKAYEQPQGEIEETLVVIWQELLHIERVGRNDNFFELGGHSLLATQLMSKIRSRLDVDLPLKALFEGGGVAQLAELIANAEKNDIPPILPINRSQFERLPLSFAQERLWFINQLEPDSAGYNIPAAVTIDGKLDIDQLDQAFNLVIARHENLRTVFPSQEGRAYQRILDGVDFKLERIDISDYETRETLDNEARRLCQADAVTSFDLANGPLLRGTVIRLDEQEHILMLNMHHIISDGWSAGVLINELRMILDAFREGRQPQLAPLPIQYVDYSVWQRQWLEEGGVLEQQLAYWRDKLAGVPENLDLATDFPRPSVQTYAGATHTFVLDRQLTRELKRLAEQQGGTLYMVLLSAFNVLLHRYTGQNDLCVGSPIANRQHGETEGLIGMFVNTLALRTQIEGDDTFADLLSKVKATCLEAYENQDAPFEKVVDVLHLQRNMAISPVFQVMLILQNVDMGTPDSQIRGYPLHSGISKFDLTAAFSETAEGLAGSIEYSTALYKAETITRMVGHFIGVCKAITAASTAKIQDLEYLGEAEKQRLLVEFNATQADFPKDQCLHQLFVEQVAGHSGDTAVTCGDEQITYQQLYARSYDLALYLQGQGVEPDRLVGLCMDRTLEMVVGLLGILQAGGAYVPLDPDYPEQRLAYMVRDSGAAIVLTQERLQDKLRSVIPAETQLIAVDSQREEIVHRVAELKARNVGLRQQVGPHHLSHVIYTSGSTGEPKGVAIEHHSPVTLVHWARAVYRPEELAGVLAATSICFDLSVYEIFLTLASGGTIILVPNALGLVDLANQESVTLINTVPSAMEELVRLGAIPDSVQTINLAGEPLSPRLVDKIYETSAVRKVYDLYGPTEDTTYSTYVLRRKNGPQTIGRPIANTQVSILDRNNQIQPIGVPGELHIAGEGLARGYLNRPELTQEKFVANPFQPGTRMYKTGDLGRWLDDGTLQYLGRIDTQVKIRGFRIELGEIEARLNQHTTIQDSVVVAQGEGVDKYLVAFYRAKQTTADEIVQLPNEELRAHLLRTLPDYMVPSAFVSLAAIPLNPNGKVDRRALARMDVTMASDRAYVAPRNETERQLVAIWAEVLKVVPEKIGINDNFFELGGHSLSAVQLMAKINRHFQQMLPLAILFTSSTIAALGKLISSAEAPSFDILVPIRTDGSAPPVFAVPGAGGNVLSLRPLSRALGDQQPLFALQAVGLDGKTPPLGSVEQTARANIVALQTVQPAGPYSLIGHSYGGVVAYEMARILVEQGEGISSLILLDSIAPPVMQRNPAHDEAAELVDACTAVAHLYDADVEIDIARLRQSTADENVEYIVQLMNERGLEINVNQFIAFYRVYRANLCCYRAYTPSMLSRKIDVSLYRATHHGGDFAAMPPDYGWNQLLQSPLRACDVEADHYSILAKVRIPAAV